VMSPATARSWQLDVGVRQRRLAAELRSLATAVPLDPGSAGAIALAETIRRWDSPRSGNSSMAEVCALLDEAGATQAIVAQRVLETPLRVARRINEALTRIRRATSFADILRTAPMELCASCGFDRVLISQVDRSTWLPVGWHVAADADSPANAAFREYVRDARISLANGMIEAEIVRRRAPALVRDARAEPRTFAPLRDLARSSAYLVAPIVASGGVVGLLHADTYTSGRALAEADRVHLRAFADGLGLIIERTVLLDRLSSQRERISRAFATAEHLVNDLCAAPVQLNRTTAVVAVAPARADSRPDDGLTPRERDVIALLASGATNAEIADRLTVSETTVKSHVKHILRKLRAANRAEAIARYLGLARLRRAS